MRTSVFHRQRLRQRQPASYRCGFVELELGADVLGSAVGGGTTTTSVHLTFFQTAVKVLCYATRDFLQVSTDQIRRLADATSQFIVFQAAWSAYYESGLKIHESSET
jgi:hypothetical protein